MEILIAVFALFAVGSLAALIKFEGNPLFLFSFLLSSASALWLGWIIREESRRTRTAKEKRGKKRP